MVAYVWSPLAPSPSRIAGYVETLIAADPDFEEVRFVTQDARQRHGRDAVAPEGAVWNEDRALLEVGNDIHHGYVLERARMGGAVIELHDLSLHHLHAELTLARGDFPGYLSGLQEAEGDWGRRLAYQRSRGLHTPRLEYYLRVSRAICQRAEAIIVHSRWARFQIQVQDIDTPVYMIPHFATTREQGLAVSRTRKDARVRLGLDGSAFVVLCAGDPTSVNRLDWVLDAFEQARDRGVNAALVIAGTCEDTPVSGRVGTSRHADAIRVTGPVGAEIADEYLLAADIVSVMRFPSAGGSSDLVAHALGFGRLVAVPEYAAFSDLPDDICEKIHLNRPVVEQLAAIFEHYADSPGHLASIEMRAEGYALRHLRLEDQREALKTVLDRHWH